MQKIRSKDLSPGWQLRRLVGQTIEGQEPLETVSVVHVLGPEMGVLVRIALSQHAPRMRERETANVA